MKSARDEEAETVTHVHDFKFHNPFHPSADVCSECGMHRYELMGPFARRRARLAAYEHMGGEIARR